MTKTSKVLECGWSRVRFGDVVRVSKERCQDPLADGVERFIGLEHIDPEDLRIKRWGSVADGVTFTNVFKPGQVLFGKRRAYQRKVAVADFSGVCSGDIYVLESLDATILLPELLPFICQTEAFFDHAVGTSAGSLSPRTNWKSLAEFEFALPPLKEQHHILSLLLAALHSVYASEDVALRIDDLRKSLITHHLGKKYDVFGIETPWGKIPTHWKYLPVKNIATESAYGPRFPSTLYSESGNVKTIRTTDFMGNDELDLSRAPAAQLAQSIIDEHQLVDDDFLLSRSGEYAGKTRVFQSIGQDSYIPAAFLIRYRLKQELLRSKYLHYICSSPVGQAVLSTLVQGSAQPNIAGSSFLGLKIPIPPIAEQDEIITLIDNFSKAQEHAAKQLLTSRAVMNAVLLPH